MRWPNDIRLAENVQDIDLLLGGHDHDFIIKQVCRYCIPCYIIVYETCAKLCLSKPINFWLIYLKWDLMVSGKIC